MELMMNKIPDSWKKNLEAETKISNIEHYILEIISEADNESNNRFKLFALGHFNIDIEIEKVLDGKKVDTEKLFQTTLKSKNEIVNHFKNIVFSIYSNAAPNRELFINEYCRYLYSLNSPLLIKGSLESLRKSLTDYKYHEKIINFHNTFSNHLQNLGYNEAFPVVMNIESFLYKNQENKKKEIEQENKFLKEEIEVLKKLSNEKLTNTETVLKKEIEIIENKYKTASNKISELEAKLNYFYNGDIFRATVFGSDYHKIRKIYDFLKDNELLSITPSAFYFNIDEKTDGKIEVSLQKSDFTNEDMGCFFYYLKHTFQNDSKTIDFWLKNRVTIYNEKTNEYKAFKKHIRPYKDTQNQPEKFNEITTFFNDLIKK